MELFLTVPEKNVGIQDVREAFRGVAQPISYDELASAPKLNVHSCRYGLTSDLRLSRVVDPMTPCETSQHNFPHERFRMSPQQVDFMRKFMHTHEDTPQNLIRLLDQCRLAIVVPNALPSNKDSILVHTQTGQRDGNHALQARVPVSTQIGGKPALRALFQNHASISWWVSSFLVSYEGMLDTDNRALGMLSVRSLNIQPVTGWGWYPDRWVMHGSHLHGNNLLRIEMKSTAHNTDTDFQGYLFHPQLKKGVSRTCCNKAGQRNSGAQNGRGDLLHFAIVALGGPLLAQMRTAWRKHLDLSHQIPNLETPRFPHTPKPAYWMRGTPRNIPGYKNQRLEIPKTCDSFEKRFDIANELRTKKLAQQRKTVDRLKRLSDLKSDFDEIVKKSCKTQLCAIKKSYALSQEAKQIQHKVDMHKTFSDHYEAQLKHLITENNNILRGCSAINVQSEQSSSLDVSELKTHAQNKVASKKTLREPVAKTLTIAPRTARVRSRLPPKRFSR